MGSIPGLGRSPKEGNGNPLQYSFLRNPMNRGAWRAIVCGVMSQIRLSNCVHAHTHTHTHTHTVNYSSYVTTHCFKSYSWLLLIDFSKQKTVKATQVTVSYL